MNDERLPPNQTLTRKLPVVGEKEPGRPIDLDSWRLVIEVDVDELVVLTYKDVLNLPQRDRKTDIHCVTGWSRFDSVFTGFPLRDLFDSVFPATPEASFVRFVAYSERNHDVTLPLDLALEDSWLVHSVDGEPLSVSRGFPLRVLTPSRYLYKSLKWVHRIILQAEDQLGFWERASGYHNNADPWKEQRLSAHRFTSRDEADDFRQLRDYSEYRKPQDPKVIVKADFSGWIPKTRDLRGLQLKACSFRKADLSGCDFTGANLTLSKFDGANLEGANFTGADLEGADFSGARLAGSTFSGNFLSATSFRKNQRGLLSHEGMSVIEPDGLLESQVEYLAEIGVSILGSKI